MVNKCVVIGCRSGYESQKKYYNRHKDNSESSVEKDSNVTIFSFPLDKPDLNQRWIKFVNRKDWKPTSYSGICIKHFENKYIKIGKRARLLYELLPIPTISGNSDDVPLPLQPTPSLPLRKPPKKRSIASTNPCVHLLGFSFMKCEGYVVFYKLGKNHHNVPEVAESIMVDEQMHVKLFFRGLTVPLPEWFRKGNNIDCKLSSKVMLDNFPSYIQNRISPGLTTIIDELRELQYYKPTGRPKYSAAILRYALYLRYTSRQAYKILQEQFPLPSFSLLRKIHNGGVDPLKAIKLLLNEGSVNSDIALLVDEIYIESYQVAVYIAGYVAKKLTERSDCNACISMLKASSNDLSHAEYLRNMSRGGLIIPSLQLAQYVSSGFSTLDFVDNLISKFEVTARIAAEHILKLFYLLVGHALLWLVVSLIIINLISLLILILLIFYYCFHIFILYILSCRFSCYL